MPRRQLVPQAATSVIGAQASPPGYRRKIETSCAAGGATRTFALSIAIGFRSKAYWGSNAGPGDAGQWGSEITHHQQTLIQITNHGTARFNQHHQQALIQQACLRRLRQDPDQAHKHLLGHHQNRDCLRRQRYAHRAKFAHMFFRQPIAGPKHSRSVSLRCARVASARIADGWDTTRVATA